jgi:hypothetical protein
MSGEIYTFVDEAYINEPTFDEDRRVCPSLRHHRISARYLTFLSEYETKVVPALSIMHHAIGEFDVRLKYFMKIT